jgi:predicted ATPase
MPRIAIAGAPGAGKTTLLAGLARLGYHTVSDSAREVIRERRAAGLTPRPDPLQFARQILQRDVAKYEAAVHLPGLVFFERTGLEALAMIREANRLDGLNPDSDDPSFTFHKWVFVLPPWKEIYVTDSERDHSFEHALHVHDQVKQVYGRLGYEVSEVPRGTSEQRAQHVLRLLDASDA